MLHIAMLNLIGQERALRALHAGLAAGTPAHAYLFAGPPRVGKRTLALQFAQALNCRQPDPPCGACSSCRRIAELKHPDVQLVTQVPSKEDRRTRDISIGQVREVEQSIALKAYEGGTRVIIADPADAMSIPAQNSFLKTLEEPPPDVVLILITTHALSILETIRSRCALVEFGLAARRDVEAALAGRGVAAEQAALFARLAEGRTGLALAYAEQPELMEARLSALAAARALVQAPLPERFRQAERLAALFSEDRDAFADTLGYYTGWWRDVLLAAAGSTDEVVNADLWEDLAADASRYPAGDVAAFLRALERCWQRLSVNIHPRLALEALALAAPAPSMATIS